MESKRRRVQNHLMAGLLGIVFGGGLVLDAPWVDAQQKQRDPSTLLTMNVADGFTVTSVGDLILSHPATPYPENKPLADMLRAADVATGNCEGSIVDTRRYREPARSRELWAVSEDPSVAKDLKEMGLKICSRANNHDTDWGVDGMRETDRWLDEAGVLHAGTGETRSLARAAQYYDTPKGRFAMVSMASTFDLSAIAEDPNGMVPGRPGLSAVRTTRYVIVTADEMQELRKIRDAHRGASGGGAGQPPLYPPPATPGAFAPAADELSLFGVLYRVGDKPGVSYKMDPVDEHEILRSIRTAKENSDFVVATMHSHETPADFVTKLAHEAIDAGADEWVGHGPHGVEAIEIYKGKAIFYGLGSFFFEFNLASQPVNKMEYEAREMDPAQVTDEEYSAKSWDTYGPESLDGVMVTTRYVKNRLTEVRIYPVDLGWERRPAERGAPRLASPEVARAILERVQKKSEPFGTAIAIEGNVGVIRLNQPSEEGGQRQK
jgi:poly-gamma-glutamate capsule biosynthesis protein CapA/YwtB (metallophosphatase superfamily)